MTDQEHLDALFEAIRKHIDTLEWAVNRYIKENYEKRNK